MRAAVEGGRPARHAGSGTVTAAGRPRRGVHRPRSTEGLRMVGRRGPGRVQGRPDRGRLSARRTSHLRRCGCADRGWSAPGAWVVHPGGSGRSTGFPGQQRARDVFRQREDGGLFVLGSDAECWCSRRWRRRSSWSGPVVTASTVDGVGPADRSSGPSSRYCWERAAAWRPGCSCTALIPSPDS